MKKTLFILVVIIITQNGFGQKDTVQNNLNHKIKIGFSFAPEYSHRRLINNGGNSIIDTIVNNLNKDDFAKIGFSTGVTFEYTLNNKISLLSGVLLSNKGYRTKKTNRDVRLYKDPVKGWTSRYIYDQPPIKEHYYMYNLYYLDIPLKIYYKLGNDDLRVSISTGIITNILLSANYTKVQFGYGRTNFKVISKLTNVNELNFSPTFGIGISKLVNQKNYLTAEPTVQYGLIKTTNFVITHYLWSIGLTLRYELSL